jgi:hypothetical protein
MGRASLTLYALADRTSARLRGGANHKGRLPNGESSFRGPGYLARAKEVSPS